MQRTARFRQRRDPGPAGSDRGPQSSMQFSRRPAEGTRPEGFQPEQAALPSILHPYVQEASICQIANVGGSSEQHAKPANKAIRNERIGLEGIRVKGDSRRSHEQQVKAGEQSHKNTSGRVRRNPGLKDRLVAVRTSSMSRRANRAIKIADTYRGPSCGPTFPAIHGGRVFEADLAEIIILSSLDFECSRHQQ